MAGRFGRLAKFAGLEWGIRTGLQLDEILTRFRDSLRNLNLFPGAPKQVIGGKGSTGSGPAPAYWDHVHQLDILTGKGQLLGFTTQAAAIPAATQAGLVPVSTPSSASGISYDEPLANVFMLMGS